MAHGENPPIHITPGAIRYNTDSAKLEYFRIGVESDDSGSYAGIGTQAAGEWVEVTTDSPFLHTGGTRAIIMGGYHPSNAYLDEIMYVNMAHNGNSIDFGLLSVDGRNHVNSCLSDRTRGISAGGSKFPGVTSANMEFVTMASTGNSVDFGADLTGVRYGPGVAADSTRGIISGGLGSSPSLQSIDYITIQSKGIAAKDFGNLHSSRRYPSGNFSTPTRGYFVGGINAGGSYLTSVDMINISTEGNGVDFGDQQHSMSDHKGGITSNAVRGIIMGGNASPVNVDTIEYFTLTSLGNYNEFGNLSAIGSQGAGAASATRCLKMGQGSPAYHVDIDFVEIMTTGDAVDFGDLNTQPTGYAGACTNGHGGLG